MYGVFWTTPPQSAASTVAPASVRRMSRARYSSPAAAALSVLSIPPMIVTSAKGNATERYGSVVSSASSQARGGHGTVTPSATRTGRPSSWPPPSHARSQKRAVPARTAANAPGRPSGIRTPPKSPSSSTTSATRPTSGSRRIFSIGRNAIRRTATPAMEPSSAARGTTRRAQSPTKARPTLARPIASVATIPTFHASTGSPVATITGPSTPNTIANRVGVSMPNGMAVTSSRPVRRPSLTASQVYARSPTRTPSAVPGTIRPSTRSAGNLKTPIRRLERMTSWVTLSRASPRNPLRSPEAIQAWRRSARSAVGGPLGALGAPQDPRELPRPVGERRAPREAPAVVRHLAVVELHQGAHLVSGPEPRAVGLPRAGVARLELDLHAGIDALGVRGEKIPEPARDLVVAAAGEHGGTLRRLRVRPRSSAGAAGATLLGGGFGRGAKPPAEGQHSLKPHERHFLHPSS